MTSYYSYFAFVVVLMTFLHKAEAKMIAKSNGADIEERKLAEMELRGGTDKLKGQIKQLKKANKDLKKKDKQLEKEIGKNDADIASLMQDHGACPDGCSMNGVCISSEGVCVCNEGYYGANCADFCEDRTTCNNRGYCNAMGNCECDDGPEYYNGCTVYCNVTTKCSDNGQCAPDGSCDCDDGYLGQYCQHYCDDMTTCSGNGYCWDTNGLCFCDDGFYGPNCDSTETPVIRLNGTGSSGNQGFVEVFNGTWEALCRSSSYHWQLDEANIVCQMLGYPGAEAALYSADEFGGTGNTNFTLKIGGCVGNETTIFDCSLSDGSSCTDHGLVSVICEGCNDAACNNNGACNNDGSCICNPNYYGETCDKYCDNATCSNNGQCYSNGYCFCDETYYGIDCSSTDSPDVRLVGTGPANASYGLVEVLATDGNWGGVCDDYFDIHDANVICRMFGFPGAEFAYNNDNGLATNVFGTSALVAGSSFALDDLQCTGTESSIRDCNANAEWSEDCSISEAAGLKCIDGSTMQY